MPKKLTAKQRQVLELRYIEGIPTDTLVAEWMGVSRPAVTECRERALECLKHMLATGAPLHGPEAPPTYPDEKPIMTIEAIIERALRTQATETEQAHP